MHDSDSHYLKSIVQKQPVKQVVCNVERPPSAVRSDSQFELVKMVSGQSLLPRPLHLPHTSFWTALGSGCRIYIGEQSPRQGRLHLSEPGSWPTQPSTLKREEKEYIPPGAESKIYC